MKYVSSYTNVKNSTSLDEFIKDKFDKFEDYFGRELSCHAVISKKGKKENIKCVEITLRTGKHMFRAESTTNSFHKSVDEDFDKIKKQIRRHKDKLISKKRNEANLYPLFDSSENDVEDNENQELIKIKDFKVSPISVDDAIMQMELLGHTFYAFQNIETGSINVLYKRDNGGYGLLNPML